MTGWRKRTIMEMARESWLDVYGLGRDRANFNKALKAFAKLVREDEREMCAKVCEQYADTDTWDGGITTDFHAKMIRERNNHD